MIDETRIREMKEMFGDAEFGELVELFREEVEILVASLPGQAGEELAASLHAICGSAENMGLRDLSALCRAGESQANDGLSIDTAPIGAAFEQSLRQLRDIVHPA